jgi:hypothetical protein
MTHIDPGQPPEFPDEPADIPDIDPAGTPDEVPQIEPGIGDAPDSRTFDQNAS